MKKSRFLAVLMAGIATCSMAGCGGGDTNNSSSSQVLTGDNVLRVYCVNMGYGTDWLQSVIDEFKTTDWVLEKYPGIQVGLDFNDQESFATTKIQGGKAVCNYDLLFSSYLKINVASLCTDLTETVYKKVIPGEDVTFESKVPSSMLDSVAVLSETGDASYVSVPWNGGSLGYIYNKELLESIGYEMPVTTDEFLEVSKAITAMKDDKYNLGYAFLSSSEGNDYWSYSFRTLVAQYMGYDALTNFYNGIDSYGSRSNKIFEDKGRLKALQFLEELYKPENKLIYNGSDDMNYMAAQLGFLKGNGIFMPNGSWFDNEMQDLKSQAEAAGSKIYDIRPMRTPIISSIIDVLPDKSVKDDATLRAVVRAIDNGETSYAGVTENDYKRIAEARTITYGQAAADAAIPSFAENKEIAYDFLLFMASDKGLAAAYKGNGCPLPYNYDIKAKNPTLYNSLSKFNQTRVDYLYGNAVAGAETKTPSENTKMVRYGGIALLRTEPEYLYLNFSAVKGGKTAQQIYDETTAYWTDARFSNALQKAGY